MTRSQSRLLHLKDLLVARARFAADHYDLSFSPAGEWTLDD